MQAYRLEMEFGHYLILRADGSVVFRLEARDADYAREILASLNGNEA